MLNEDVKQKILRAERILFIAVLDFLGILGSFFCALWLRFDFKFSAIPDRYTEEYLRVIPVWALFCILVFIIFRLYDSVWSYVSGDEVLRIAAAYFLLVCAGLAGIFIFSVHMPRSAYMLGIIFSAIFTVLLRFSYRFLGALRDWLGDLSSGRKKENVMIIGAGAAGRALMGDFNRRVTRVACFIDDNKNKRNKLLHGVPIVGGRESIVEAAEKYDIDVIIYAIPSGTNRDKKEILELCSGTNCKVQVVPGIYQLVNGEVSISKLRRVDAQDLLGREPVKVNLDEINGYIHGKVVMVTGGGGSIGSELCRQIARSDPKQLIVFDIYENNAYDIQTELKSSFPCLNSEVLIGSVRNTERLRYIMKKYAPEIIFHAAAHKHVPLMEDSPNEAIKNNVFGTYKAARLAAEYGVKKFVLISTDKAVNPTNIMGASKRLCEMVIQMMSRESSTEFSAVRFGNVLGSNGSVIPLFKKQIEDGGPVTVTHPEITRYFMTIPEAVSLVLQAGCYARGGEIFVLDMGEPVKIADMARNLISLSGYEPDVDIKIEYTGLRPGEKLYEELLMSEEGLKSTENEMIHIGRPIEMDDEKFKEDLGLLEAAYREESDNMKELVEKIVPTYHRQPKN